MNIQEIEERRRRALVALSNLCQHADEFGERAHPVFVHNNWTYFSSWFEIMPSKERLAAQVLSVAHTVKDAINSDSWDPDCHVGVSGGRVVVRVFYSNGSYTASVSIDVLDIREGE